MSLMLIVIYVVALIIFFYFWRKKSESCVQWITTKNFKTERKKCFPVKLHTSLVLLLSTYVSPLYITLRDDIISKSLS